jgi:hypothetical protein
MAVKHTVQSFEYRWVQDVSRSCADIQVHAVLRTAEHTKMLALETEGVSIWKE